MHCLPAGAVDVRACRFGFVPASDSLVLSAKKKKEDNEVIHIFRSGVNECKKCQALEGTRISPEIWADEEKMKSKGFWKQKNGKYLPHPNCKCGWDEEKASNKTADVAAKAKERHWEQMKTKMQLAFMREQGIGQKQAAQLAEEIIQISKQNHHVKNGEVFLFFNGEYLMSSDGKLLIPAVAGKPVKTEEKNTKATIYGYVEKEKTKHFDYSKLRQCKINEGPLPEGTYTIKREETGSLSKGSFNKHGLRRSAWGDYHWDLTPTKDTDLLGRDGNFTIHGGKDPESAGCIDVTSNDWKLKDYLRTLPQKEIYVVTKYPERNVSVTIKEPQSYPIPRISY